MIKNINSDGGAIQLMVGQAVSHSNGNGNV